MTQEATAEQQPAEEAQQPEKKERPRIPPGWHKDLSNEEYHGSAGFSSSQVKMMVEKTPAHLKFSMDDPGAEMTSDSMFMGTIVHTLVLEPDAFDTEYHVSGDDASARPLGIAGEIADALVAHGEKAEAIYRTVPTDINRRTAEGRARYKEFEKTCKENNLVIVKQEHLDKARKYWEVQRQGDGKIIISKQQHEQAKAMSASMLSDPYAKALLDGSINESSIYWWYDSQDPDDDEKYRMMVKCRPDALPRGHAVIADLKTCVDATYTGFQRAIMRYYYHLSAGMYLEGVNQNKELLEELKQWRITDFVFLIVENKPPYLSRTLMLDRNAVELGTRLYRRCIRLLQEGIRDEWPGYPKDKLVKIELPPWAERIHIV